MEIIVFMWPWLASAVAQTPSDSQAASIGRRLGWAQTDWPLPPGFRGPFFMVSVVSAKALVVG